MSTGIVFNKGGIDEVSFPEEDIEEYMVMNLVPVRSYKVNLIVRKVRKGKLKLIYEEESDTHLTALDGLEGL